MNVRIAPRFPHALLAPLRPLPRLSYLSPLVPSASVILPPDSHLTPLTPIVSGLFSLYLSSGSPANRLESGAHTLFPCTTEGVGGERSSGEASLTLETFRTLFPASKIQSPASKSDELTHMESSILPGCESRLPRPCRGATSGSRGTSLGTVFKHLKTTSVHKSDELNIMESHSCIKPPGVG